MLNQGGAPDNRTAFSFNIPRVPWQHSGKGAVKAGNPPSRPMSPQLMFIALSDVGRVDVIEMGTGKKLASIRVPGVTTVSNYWR